MSVSTRFPWGNGGTADGKAPGPEGVPAPIVPDTVRRSSRRQHDIEAAKSSHPDLPPSLIPTHATIMVMGESGLGKTTLVNNLLRSYCTTGTVTVAHDGTKTSLAAFKSDPSQLCYQLEPMTIESVGRQLVIKIQDAPGWGDDFNFTTYLQTMVEFILKCRELDHNERMGYFPDHAVAHRGELKHAITAILYFLPPHRTKPVDWIILAVLSQLVAVIPIIAKADTMTADELDRYREEIFRVVRRGAVKMRATGVQSAQPTLGPSELGEGDIAKILGGATSGGTVKSTLRPAASGGGVDTHHITADGRLNRNSVNHSSEDADGALDISGQESPSSPGSSEVGEVGSTSKGSSESGIKAANGMDGPPSSSASSAASSEEFKQQLNPLPVSIYTFRDSELTKLGVEKIMPPFAVVCSNVFDDKEVPVRRYLWGTCLPLDRDHSDLIILKQLLFGHKTTGLYDLLDDSWRRAIDFKREYAESGRRLDVMVKNVVDPVSSHLKTTGATPEVNRAIALLQKQLAECQMALKDQLTSIRKVHREKVSELQAQLTTVQQALSQSEAQRRALEKQLALAAQKTNEKGKLMKLFK